MPASLFLLLRLLWICICCCVCVCASDDIFTLRMDGASTVAASIHDEGALAQRASQTHGYACTSLQGPACSLMSGVSESLMSGVSDVAASLPAAALASLLRSVLAQTVKATAAASRSVHADEQLHSAAANTDSSPHAATNADARTERREPREVHTFTDEHTHADMAGDTQLQERLRALLQQTLSEQLLRRSVEHDLLTGSDDLSAPPLADDEDEELYHLELDEESMIALNAAELATFIARANAAARDDTEKLHIDMFQPDELEADEDTDDQQ